VIVQFFDLQDRWNPANGATVGDSQTLRALLESMRHRPPPIAEPDRIVAFVAYLTGDRYRGVLSRNRLT
jgi:hypothetical protein